MSLTKSPFPGLNRDQATDLCIVGAGIAGLINAYIFLKKGYKVIVLEKGDILSGESEKSTGQLSFIHEEGLQKLIELQGLDNTREIIKSHQYGLQLLQDLIKIENIDCDFRLLEGYLFSSSEGPENYLEGELHASNRLGLFSSELAHNPDLSTAGEAICYRDQAALDLRKFCRRLAEIIKDLGGQIYTQTEVTQFSDITHPTVKTKNGCIVYCQSLLFTTNKPLHNKITLHNQQRQVKSFVIGIEIPKGSFPDILYWDSRKPAHYANLIVNRDRETDTLLIGGEDIDCDTLEAQGISEAAIDSEGLYQRLADFALFELGLVGEISFKWSGNLVETPDGIPYIGRPCGSKNVYIINGNSGHGITNSALSSRILADLIESVSNPWIQIYSPYRFKLRAYTHSITNAKAALVKYRRREERRQEMRKSYEFGKTKKTIQNFQT